MKGLKAPSLSRTALVALAVMVAAAAGAVGLAYLLRSGAVGARSAQGARGGGERVFRERLAEADYELSLGYRERAVESLSAALRAAASERSLLSVLKRARAVALASGDYAPLYRLSLAALERKAGSRRIGEVHLYAAARADSGGRAGLWLSRLAGRRESEAVVAEAHLRGRTPAKGELDEERLSEGMRALLALRDERDPRGLEAAGALHGDPRLWQDAALGWMLAGETERALGALGRAGDLAAAAEPGVFMAYDAGRDEQALALLQTRVLPAVKDRPDLAILRADLALLLGRRAEAETAYRNVLAGWPGYSWVPYLNLATLSEASGDRAAVEGLLARAHELFPESEEAALRYAVVLEARQDRTAALGVVEAYLERSPDSAAAALRLLELRGTAATPAVYTAGLWDLLRRHPEDERLCRPLSLYLMGLRDYDGAAAALAEHDRAASGAGKAWVQEYRGVLSALQGDYAEATAALTRSIEAQATWRRHYNLAVVHAAAGRAQAAVESLRQAEELLPDAREGGAARAAIRAFVAEQLMALHDIQGARRECEYALDLDPVNHRARLVMRILEGL